MGLTIVLSETLFIFRHSTIAGHTANSFYMFGDSLIARI